MMVSFRSIALLSLFASTANAWSVSRREAVAAIVAFPSIANALPSEETPRSTTRMGGLLEPYQDGPRGFRVMVPSGT